MKLPIAVKMLSKLSPTQDIVAVKPMAAPSPSSLLFYMDYVYDFSWESFADKTFDMDALRKFKEELEKLSGVHPDTIARKCLGENFRTLEITKIPETFNRTVGFDLIKSSDRPEDSVKFFADYYLLEEKEFKVKYTMKDLGIL